MPTSSLKLWGNMDSPVSSFRDLFQPLIPGQIIVIIAAQIVKALFRLFFKIGFVVIVHVHSNGRAFIVLKVGL